MNKEDAKNSKRDIFLKWATVIVSIVTLILSGIICWNTIRKDAIILNQPDNLIVRRISDSGEMMYSVESLENSHRYSEVRVTPVLHIYCKDFNGLVIDEEFVYLNKFFVDCVADTENSIIAFKDLSYNGISYDNLLRSAARYYNTNNNEIYVDCDIIYMIQFKYLNNKNKYQKEITVLSRESTAIDLSSKERLLVDIELKEKISKAMNRDDINHLDSVIKINYQGFEYNCTVNPTEELIDSITSECLDYIETFQNKHKIISFYITQNESKR